MKRVAIDDLDVLVGRWDVTVDLPGAEDVRGDMRFERMGEVLLQHSTVPSSPVPESWSVIVANAKGGYTQHYFDSRGVARLYEMTFDGRTWTLERTHADFTPLAFHQRYIGHLDDDRKTIEGEWQRSGNGRDWDRDFALTHRRTGS